MNTNTCTEGACLCHRILQRDSPIMCWSSYLSISVCVPGADDGSPPSGRVWSPPRLWQWETQLMLFIVSAWQAHSRKWLVKSYLFGEAEATWMKLCSCRGRGWMGLLGWAEQRQEGLRWDGDLKSESTAVRPQSCTASPPPLNFPAVSTRDIEHFWRAGVDTQSERTEATFSADELCNTASFFFFVVVVYRRDLIKLGQVKAGS